MNDDNKGECVGCTYWRFYTTGTHYCTLNVTCPHEKNKKECEESEYKEKSM